MELYCLVVTVTCLVCLGFSGVMCSEFDPLIKTYVSSSQLTNENLVYSRSKLRDQDTDITYHEWDSLVIKSKLPVVVVFRLDGCSECDIMVSLLYFMDKKYKDKFKFYTVNIQIESLLAVQFEIATLPTSFVFKGGEQMAKVIGADLDKLMELVKKYM